MLETPKITTSLCLERDVRQKMKRIAKILKITESELMQNSLKHYFETTEIVQEAQRKIIADRKFLEAMGCTAIRPIKYGNTEGWEYRKEYDKKEDD